MTQLFIVARVAAEAHRLHGHAPAWVASTRPTMPGFCYVPWPPLSLSFDWLQPSDVPTVLVALDPRVEWRVCGGCSDNSGLYAMPGGEPVCWWVFEDGVVIESRPERCWPRDRQPAIHGSRF